MIILSMQKTHKSWQAIQVLLFGTLELLQEYIREEDEEPSGFWNGRQIRNVPI